MTEPADSPGSSSYWDAQAGTFDSWPDHGLAEPGTRAAWSALLLGLLPEPPARVVDIGCGTGSLAVLLAEHGYEVEGVDFSPAMVSAAQAKARAAGVGVRFRVADAHDPGLRPGPSKSSSSATCCGPSPIPHGLSRAGSTRSQGMAASS